LVKKTLVGGGSGISRPFPRPSTTLDLRRGVKKQQSGVRGKGAAQDLVGEKSEKQEQDKAPKFPTEFFGGTIRKTPFVIPDGFFEIEFFQLDTLLLFYI
jgi:hypothetical protein